MKGSQDVLASILKTSQMGQVGIRCLIGKPMRSNLRNALKSQLQEYDSIEDDARVIAGQYGWELSKLAPIAKIMSSAMIQAKLSHGCTDSKIAEMMIQGNTRGMIKSIANQHQYLKQDDKISALSQKLIDSEIANIRQMQHYL